MYINLNHHGHLELKKCKGQLCGTSGLKIETLPGIYIVSFVVKAVASTKSPCGRCWRFTDFNFVLASSIIRNMS